MYEAKGTSRRRHGKEYAGNLAVGFLFIVTPIATSILGWHQGSAMEEKANQDAAEEVVRLHRCQEIVHILPERILLSSVDEDTATACNVPTKTEVAISISKASDVALYTNSVTIALPTDTQLDQQISASTIEAQNFDTETQRRYAVAFGLILGGGIDLLMFGTILDW